LEILVYCVGSEIYFWGVWDDLKMTGFYSDNGGGFGLLCWGEIYFLGVFDHHVPLLDLIRPSGTFS